VDVARFVGREKHREVRDIFGFSPAFQLDHRYTM
jgi:hypothetical protein